MAKGRVRFNAKCVSEFLTDSKSRNAIRMKSMAFLTPSLHSSAFFGNLLPNQANIGQFAQPGKYRAICSSPSRRVRARQSPIAQLERHKLGSSDLEVTEVCLGTMTWGRQNSLEDATAQLDYAVKDRGVNFIDTAEMYPIPINDPNHVPGRTESYIGEWIASNPSWREKIVLASKVVGYSPNSKIAAFRHPNRTFETGNYPNSCLDRQNIHDACNASLKRLNTDYIDLYQLHWPDRYVPLFGPRLYDPSKERESTPIKETLGALKELLDHGKIRAYGLSNETSFGVAEFVRAADELGMPRPASIQNSFCLLNRKFEGELAEACAPSHYNIGLMPFSILAGGVLSGKYLGKIDADGNVTDPELQDSRFSLYNNFMKRYMAPPVQEAVVRYKQIADEAGMSLATLAQSFCKSRFFVPSSIIGATTVDQLEENINAFNVKLGDEVLAKIDDVHAMNKDVASQG